VVIDDFEVEGIAALEAKTYAPLVVDADALAFLAVALQFFQSVLRGNTQIIDARGTVQHLQFSFGHHPDIHEARYGFSGKQGLRVGAFERLDHPHEI
jgi:hypothetical protein